MLFRSLPLRHLPPLGSPELFIFPWRSRHRFSPEVSELFWVFVSGSAWLRKNRWLPSVKPAPKKEEKTKTSSEKSWNQNIHISHNIKNDHAACKPLHFHLLSINDNDREPEKREEQRDGKLNGHLFTVLSRGVDYFIILFPPTRKTIFPYFTEKQ